MNIILISVIPVVIILLYVYIRDRKKPEPFIELIKAFFAGVIIVLPILFFGDLLPDFKDYSNGIEASLKVAFYSAAIPEEGLKFLAFYFLIWRNKEFNEYFDGIVYAVFISLGFACFENILYVSEGGISVAIARAFTAVPAHAIFGILMGYFFALAKYKHNYRLLGILNAFIVPVIVHGLYDFFIMAYSNLSNSGNETISILFFVAFWIFFIYSWKLGMKKINALSGK